MFNRTRSFIVCYNSKLINDLYTNVYVQRRYENTQALKQVTGARTTSTDGRLTLAKVHEKRKTVFQIVHLIFVPITRKLTFPDELVGKPCDQAIFDYSFSLSRSTGM